LELCTELLKEQRGLQMCRTQDREWYVVPSMGAEEVGWWIRDTVAAEAV